MAQAEKPGTPTQHDDDDETISSGEAAMRLGISKRQLGRMVFDGNLHPIVDDKGRRRFAVEEIEDARDYRQPAADTSEILGQAVTALKTSNEHVRLLLGLVVQHSQLLVAENTDLRQHRTRSFEIVEAALSQQTEREIAAKAAIKKDERRELLMGYVGGLVGEFMKNMELDRKKLANDSSPAQGENPGEAPQAEQPTSSSSPASETQQPPKETNDGHQPDRPPAPRRLRKTTGDADVPTQRQQPGRRRERRRG